MALYMLQSFLSMSHMAPDNKRSGFAIREYMNTALKKRSAGGILTPTGANAAFRSLIGALFISLEGSFY